VATLADKIEGITADPNLTADEKMAKIAALTTDAQEAKRKKTTQWHPLNGKLVCEVRRSGVSILRTWLYRGEGEINIKPRYMSDRAVLKVVEVYGHRSFTDAHPEMFAAYQETHGSYSKLAHSASDDRSKRLYLRPNLCHVFCDIEQYEKFLFSLIEYDGQERAIQDERKTIKEALEKAHGEENEAMADKFLDAWGMLKKEDEAA